MQITGGSGSVPGANQHALAEMLKSECNMSCKEQKTGINKQILLNKVKSQVGSVLLNN
jgi:hypothetical protein